MAIWYSLWWFGIFIPFLVCLDQEKSGNPDQVISRENTYANCTLAFQSMQTLHQILPTEIYEQSMRISVIFFCCNNNAMPTPPTDHKTVICD
jgi:hypothetical protein